MTDDKDRAVARQARQAGIAIAAGGVLAILAPVIVSGLGLPVRYEFLFYLIAIAAFIWALVVTARIWQKSRDKRD
ncbi:DUF5337 domain-containing protein [Pelagovum pacificum]|uniref:Uncharacterized protein n=1 Tax=Pelagovum pacificum TaxID=2588711 RepID=A0A5C5GFD7_9RHOB|nr:DUF5337 domain-containing protein [Pelagovum pacificum]QQA44186.1 DUF5337 domain-containing protein [Pelagovum pacificum]TNY32691.1 hypothetical protein FHY64_05265 [Pelagovum pacificum]